MRQQTNKTKVLFVLPGTTIGGAEIKTFNLLSSLNSFNRVLITQSPIRTFYSELELDIYTFEDFGCMHPNIFSPGNIFSYARAIKKVFDLEKPNIILGIMHSGTLFVTVSQNLFFLRALPIVTIEGNISAYFKNINRPPTLKERLLLKYSFKRAKGIIVPSEGVKKDLVNHYCASEKKIITIYNGIDIENIKKASEEEITYKKDCPWIVTACRLNFQKDFDTLLKAFRIVRDKIKAKLFIIGDGELKDDIFKLSSELGLDKDIIMPGFQKNPFTYISKADVFVLSSFFEGFGNVIVEAMSLGIPVVSTDCPSGPGEIIRDKENGFLVPVRDFHEMASRFFLIFNDNGLKKNISREAQKRSQDFSINSMEKDSTII
ncbi:MAG: glycosyltransferase [Candidatus Mariimomonas ferrooxydans]